LMLQSLHKNFGSHSVDFEVYILHSLTFTIHQLSIAMKVLSVIVGSSVRPSVIRVFVKVTQARITNFADG